jgi:hypothetical protein
VLPLTSSVWCEPLDKIIRRKLMPNLEHVTWSEPTVTPSRLAISWRFIPCATSFLILSITSGVNLTRLPLGGELTSYAVVMAALERGHQNSQVRTDSTKEREFHFLDAALFNVISII